MAEEFDKKDKAGLKLFKEDEAGLELSEDLIKIILDLLERPNTLL
jgi:hypothetical protein